VGRIADGQRLGDGFRLHRLEEVPPCLEGCRDRGAAFCLCPVDLRPHVVDETQGLHFMEPLPDLGQERTRRHRDDHLVRGAPAEWAATELARLPVEAQAMVSNPNSRALVMATATTRSLNDKVG